MSNRCPYCMKMVSLDFPDPEVEDPSITFNNDGSIDVTCDARIFRACAECGTEMKEANFNLEENILLTPDVLKEHCLLYDAAEAGADHKPDLKYKMKEGHEFEAKEDGIDQIEEGGGRYAKSYFGVSVNVIITCKCQNSTHKRPSEPVAELTLSDRVPASGMDEC